MNRDEAKQAVRDGIADFIKQLAANEARNEVTESADEAETQFERGLRFAKDALDRGLAGVEKIFSE